MTLLVDQLVPGGLTLVVPGVDHYFEHPDREIWTSAMLRSLVSWTTTEQYAVR